MKWRLGIAVLAFAFPVGADGNAEVVASHKILDRSSLAVDPAGNPAIAYGTDAIYYAAWNGSAWRVETVDDASCEGPTARAWAYDFPSLAFDPGGNPAIAYVTRGGLHLARRAGTTWSIEVADGADRVGTHISLAFDPSGNPAIAYHEATAAVSPDPGANLRYAAWDGAAWQIETLSSAGNVGRGAALAFDGDGRPAVSYAAHRSGNASVELARRDAGGQWRFEVVERSSEPVVGDHTDLAFRSDGLPVVAYEVEVAGDPRDFPVLRLATATGTGWTHETAYPAGFSRPSLVLDAGDAPHIAFDLVGGRSVCLASRRRPEPDPWDRWSYCIQGNSPSLALDPSGTFLVSHRNTIDPDAHGLELGRFDGTSFAVETVDRGVLRGWSPDDPPALAFDSASGPWLGHYLDGSGGFVRLHRRQGGSFTAETVAAVEWGPAAVSLALDALDRPALAYAGEVSRFDGLAWERFPTTGFDYLPARALGSTRAADRPSPATAAAPATPTTST